MEVKLFSHCYLHNRIQNYPKHFQAYTCHKIEFKFFNKIPKEVDSMIDYADDPRARNASPKSINK